MGTSFDDLVESAPNALFYCVKAVPTCYQSEGLKMKGGHLEPASEASVCIRIGWALAPGLEGCIVQLRNRDDNHPLTWDLVRLRVARRGTWLIGLRALKSGVVVGEEV
jgi:hypothetical protein